MFTYIVALLYWIEYAVQKQNEESCTVKANKWIEPFTTKKVSCLQLDAIDFASSEKQMKLYEHGKPTTTGAVTTATITAATITTTAATSTTANTTTTATAVTTANAISDSSEVQQFFDKCLTSPSLPILFSVLDEPYCNSFAKSADHLPVSLQSVYGPEHLQCTYFKLLEAGEQMAGLLETYHSHTAKASQRNDMRSIKVKYLVTF